jgi:hypothetical protein
VLLVDDDEVNRRIVEQVLQVSGCMIDVAVDGVGAVERMNLEKYILVLMVSLFFAFVGSFTDLDSCSCRVLSCLNWTVYRRRR